MRVTVDQDNSELLALMAFYNMRFRYETTPTMWRTGYGGGVHFIVRDLPLRWDEALQERALFRDDVSRVWLDAACSHKPPQTLFMSKHIDNHGWSRWPLDEKSLLALPFWVSRIRRLPMMRKMRKATEQANGRRRLACVHATLAF